MHDLLLEARLDAVVLFAYFGPPERAALLHEVAERETVPELKAIAERGYARLLRMQPVAGQS